MSNQLPTALFLFTDKNCTPLKCLPDEAANIKNIFNHHEAQIKYEAAHNFLPKAFTETMAAHGKNAHIFHLAGHSTEEGFVINGNPAEATFLNADLLSSFLKNSPNLQIFFINACNSLATIEAINTLNIPLRIGVKGDIADNYAMEASVQFYNALLLGNTFERAFNLLNSHYNLLEGDILNVFYAFWQITAYQCYWRSR